ncbi:MAG: hypothetical protein M0P71_01000 [Melioribacteraceae bacterium]|nr:hypothetical protein [Melioribacteraceae bacterium]
MDNNFLVNGEIFYVRINNVNEFHQYLYIMMFIYKFKTIGNVSFDSYFEMKKNMIEWIDEDSGLFGHVNRYHPFFTIERRLLGNIPYNMKVFTLSNFKIWKNLMGHIPPLNKSIYYYISFKEPYINTEEWTENCLDKQRLFFGNVFIDEREAKYSIELLKKEKII